MPTSKTGQGSPNARERLDRLRLIRTENVGPITFRDLMRRFGSAGAAIDALPELSRRGGRRRPLRPCTVADAQAEQSAVEAIGGIMIVVGEPAYPPQLAAIEDAPPVLTTLGHPSLLRERAVAIVGARNASANGQRLAERMASDLSDEGFIVVSGLALGIDAAAHRGSLAKGTVAVIAGGIDQVYPPANGALRRDIAETGVIVTESRYGTVPQARHFPARNRIISGLSLGTVVIEATRHSGSLITARQALDQGREVFAIPGSPLYPRAAGPNGLLREGAAHLVESASDVADILNGMGGLHIRESSDERTPEPPTLETIPKELDEARPRILELLSTVPTPVDEIVRRCQFSSSR